MIHAHAHQHELGKIIDKVDDTSHTRAYSQCYRHIDKGLDIAEVLEIQIGKQIKFTLIVFRRRSQTNTKVINKESEN